MIKPSLSLTRAQRKEPPKYGSSPFLKTEENLLVATSAGMRSDSGIHRRAFRVLLSIAFAISVTINGRASAQLLAIARADVVLDAMSHHQQQCNSSKRHNNSRETSSNDLEANKTIVAAELSCGGHRRGRFVVGSVEELVGGGVGGTSGFSSNCCCIKSFCFSDYLFTSKLAPVS